MKLILELNKNYDSVEDFYDLKDVIRETIEVETDFKLLNLEVLRLKDSPRKHLHFFDRFAIYWCPGMLTFDRESWTNCEWVKFSTIGRFTFWAKIKKKKNKQ